MSSPDKPTPRNRQSMIAALVKKLQETERELQELTGGEIDTVATGAGRHFLLSEAQEKLRTHATTLQQAAEMQSGILNALPAHIALLDQDGLIIAVNESWQHFASANVLRSPDFFVGQNYLAVCDRAKGEHSKEAAATAEGIRRVLRREIPDFAIEYSCHSPTEKRWFRMMATPVSQGPQTGAVVMHVNVSQRRAAEEILRQKEQEQRRLAEELTLETRRLHESQAVANVGSWETDLATRDVTWTDETFRIFETSPEEFNLTHRGFLERVHPEDRERVDSAFEGSIGQPGPFACEHRLLFPDGRIKFVEERWRIFDDESGQPVRALGTCQDITRQVVERAALVQSEERFRRLYEKAPDAIQLIDKQGVILDVNPATETITGYPRKELIGQKFLELDALRGEDLSRAQAALVRNAEGRGTGPAEYAVHRKDGTVITMEFEGFPIRIGEQDLVLGLGRDITARKAAERRLARVSQLYVVLSRINETIVRTKEKRSLFESACKIVVEDGGLRMAAIMVKRDNSFVVRPETHAGAEEGYFSEFSIDLRDPIRNCGTIGTAMRSGRHDVCNDTYADPRMSAWRESMVKHGFRSTASFPIREDGNVMGALVMFSEETHYFQQDEVELLSAVAEDISFAIELLRSESNLRERQSLLSSAERIGRMGSWSMDVKTGQVLWSETTAELFGIASAEFRETFEHFCSFVIPENRQSLIDANAGVTVKNPFFEVEYRIRRPDGEVRWMYERGNVEFDAVGNQVRRLGMVMDITERKHTEAERSRMFNLSLDLLSIGNFDGHLEKVNPAWTECLGWTAEELTTRPMIDFVVPEDHEATQQARALAQQGERVRGFQNRYRCKDGSFRWLSWSVHPLPESRKVFAVARDVTEQRKNEEQLRHSEQLLQIAGKAVRMGGWSVDFPENRITWSDEVCAIHDLPAGTVPPLDQVLNFYTPESRAIIESAFANCVREGTTYDVELEVVTAAGRRIWMRSIGQAERDKSGAIRRVQGACQDITEQKKAEAETLRAAETLEGIVQVQQEIANANLPLPEVMRLMAKRAEELTGAAGGVVEIVEGSEMVYAAGTGVVADKVGMRLNREGSLSGLAVSAGTVLFCDDTETDPRVDLPACRKVGVRSMVVAPLRVGEKIIGVLKVLSGGPQGFSQRDINNLQILVGTLGGVIERQRAADALRTSMEEFQSLAEAMPQIVWITNAEGMTIYLNQNWVNYTGMSLEESFGRGWTKPFHPDDQQRAWVAWQHAVSTVGSYSLEFRLRGADGDYRWWLTRGEPQKDASGNVLKWFGTCTDIHNLKLAELEITRANRALKMLSACNETLIHAMDENDLLKDICKIAVASGGYRMAWVGYAKEDTACTIQPMAHAGEETGYLSEVALTWQENSPEGSGPASRTIRSGQPHMSEDVEQDASFRRRDAARQRGFRSVICLPLRDENRTFGILGLYSGETLQISAEEIKLLQELADDLAFGILTLRARLERQRLLETVLVIARGVSTSVGDEFFQQLNQHLVGALKAHVGIIALVENPDEKLARTVSVLVANEIVEDFTYELVGTPCETVFEGELCVVDRKVQQRYPTDRMLTDWGAESYAGTPLVNSAGEIVGLMEVLFQQPILDKELIASALQIFAARASTEMERQRADASVREQAALLDKAQDAILVCDLEGGITYWNKSAERLYGWTTEQALGRSARKLLYGFPSEFDVAMEKLLAEGEWVGELTQVGNDGRKLVIEGHWTLVKDDEDHPKSVLAINTDITERKSLEQQFLRAQRMESIGTLAGGIAHDLNNLLAPILMGVSLLRRYEVHPMSERTISAIERSAQRGTNLVKQVLSFARGVEGLRVSLEVKHIVREVEGIVESTFPKSINVDIDLPRDLWLVVGDPTQIHQVLVNLCVNARDAMPNGGHLRIAVANAEIDAQYAVMNRGVTPGRYVVITVSDTGVGIPREIIDRIFEPFFTTKEQGRGTGLGLSTVVGIVRSHGGFVNVYSEPTKGTSFRVYIPAQRDAVPAESAAAEEGAAEELPRGKGELVLLVDDEETILSVTRQTLETFGYKVITASDGAQAIAAFATHRANVAVVITDMMMPIMDGPALIAALRRIDPAVKIIGASGLTSNFNQTRLTNARVSHFLPKPYSAHVMLTTLRTVIRD